MNSDINSDARKDPDRLEREIHEQRREINETLRALEARFSSRDIAGHFMHYFGGHGRDWADSLGSSLKANPLPALLAGVGIAWLMMGDRSGAHRSSYMYGARDYDGRGRFADAAASAHGAADSLRDKASELGDKAAHAGETLHEKMAHAGDALHDKMAHAGEALHEKAEHAREALRSRSSHAREGFSHARDGLEHSTANLRDNFEQIAREQPLVLGALGIALGALVGAALPRTEHETRMLGRASERIKEKGEELARRGYDTVSEKAAELKEVATEVAGQALQQQPAEQGQQPGASPTV